MAALQPEGRHERFLFRIYVSDVWIGTARAASIMPGSRPPSAGGALYSPQYRSGMISM